MSEKEPPEHPEPSLDVRRATILNSILQRGLKPSEKLGKYLGSADSIPRSRVEGYVIENEDYLKKPLLNHYLYSQHTIGSIMEIVMERPGEARSFLHRTSRNRRILAYAEARKIMEDRIHAMCLVVKKDGFSSGDMEGFLTFEKVNPEEFTAIIIPQDIWTGIESDLTVTPPCPIIPTPTMLRRTVVKTPYLKVPDFETPLRSLFQKHGRIWIHGVRLPTLADVNKNQGDS